jgi:hypothetical protein
VSRCRRVAAVTIPLSDLTVWTVKDVFDPIRLCEPATDLDSFPAILIPMRRSLAVDLDDPTTSTRDHVHAVAHCSPFEIR